MSNDQVSNHEQISGQLLALVIDLGGRLTAQQQTWAHEYLDANELGLALEMIADWLSEDSRPITRLERDVMLALADQMTMGDRVARALELCPMKPVSASEH